MERGGARALRRDAPPCFRSRSGTLRTWWLVDHPETAPYLDPHVLRLLAWASTVFLCRLAVILPVGLAVRGMPRARRSFAHAVALTVVARARGRHVPHGPVTTPLWALYPIMGCVSLLLFDARIALGGFATSVAVLYGLAVAERLGWVPYAPVFATWPEVDGPHCRTAGSGRT